MPVTGLLLVASDRNQDKQKGRDSLLIYVTGKEGAGLALGTNGSRAPSALPDRLLQMVCTGNLPSATPEPLPSHAHLPRRHSDWLGLSHVPTSAARRVGRRGHPALPEWHDWRSWAQRNESSSRKKATRLHFRPPLQIRGWRIFCARPACRWHPQRAALLNPARPLPAQHPLPCFPSA